MPSCMPSRTLRRGRSDTAGQVVARTRSSWSRAREAERVYREDLKRSPNNGWSLFGLAQALRAPVGLRSHGPTAREKTEASFRTDLQDVTPDTVPTETAAAGGAEENR